MKWPNKRLSFIPATAISTMMLSVAASYFAMLYLRQERVSRWDIAAIALCVILLAAFTMFVFRPIDEALTESDKRRQELILSIGKDASQTKVVTDIIARIVNRPRPEDQQAINVLNDQLTALQMKLEEVQAKPIDFFDKLIRITLEYVEAYYKQTQSQAEKAFALCKFAAIVSLVIIGAGITAMFAKLTTQGAVVTGVGAFGEFIAAVFFYLYNQTILKMSEYHQKLVLTQNVSLALKISESLPDADKAKAQIELIKALAKDINKYLSPVVQTAQPRAGRARRQSSK